MLVRLGHQVTSSVLLAIVISAIGAIFTGIGVVVRSYKTADVDSITNLKTRVANQDRQIASLDEWKLAGRHYIATLRGILADRGITAPDPPPALELHISGGDP